MGIYLERIKNLSIEPINISVNFEDDVFSQLVEESNSATSGFMGITILTTLWIGLYAYLLMNKEIFRLTELQSLISVTSVIYTIAIYFIWTGILTNSQHFMYISVLFFLTIVWGVIRY